MPDHTRQFGLYGAHGEKGLIPRLPAALSASRSGLPILTMPGDLAAAMQRTYETCEPTAPAPTPGEDHHRGRLYVLPPD